MLKAWIALLCVSLVWKLGRSQYLEPWTPNTSLQEVQHALGESLPDCYLNPDSNLIRQGEDLVKLGRTKLPNGKWSKYISKYYVCTTCHNLEQEDPDLRFSDPETRLTYAKAHNLPFLQGTTFKGIVNRESWYNDDYVRKYGDEKIEIAHENLREAIQLCAIECSQGRPMEDWEIEAVLAYYWSLEYTLDDLGLSEQEINALNEGRVDSTQFDEMRQFLRSKYNTKSPANFYDAPKDKKLGYEGLKGDPAKGKDLYDLSCKYCHQSVGVSHYILDDSKMSFRHLKKMIPKDSHFSLYQIIAYGTYALPGHRPYMPHYPAERMSKQQVEDLRAYIEQMAK